MSDLDLCKYVDVFYGSGETDRFFEDGLASKWFYIKALCGNTFPHATLPFGKMSVGAYSGGYPTGYGSHYPNSCGGINKLEGGNTVRGFSHIHHSGVGGIKYYYNYAITTPFYGDISSAMEYRALEDEGARPGYYSARLGDIGCELTVDGGTAIHRYSFGKAGGRVAIDFSNDGLDKRFGERFYSLVKDASVKVSDNGEVMCSGEFSGVRLYFCAVALGENVRVKAFFGESESEERSLSEIDTAKPFGAVFDFSGDALVIKISYSTVSEECARQAVSTSCKSFDEAQTRAYGIWKNALSVFKIQTNDEKFKEKFYSNLYHTLIKPSDMKGEDILGIKGDAVSELATLWDQYKTSLPLIFMCYPDMGERIAKCIVNISRTLGKIPCSLGITNIFSCEMQAKMLGIFALCDAYYMGIGGIDKETIDECIERELSREDFAEFLASGRFERYTHILDTTDACLSVAGITENGELKKRLLSLSENWRKAYDADGLMSARSPYYEGDRFTYSFRIQKNMKERVELAGGKERFAELLDRFFGFGGESIAPMRHLNADADIAKTGYHRFEGFNNECDMEAPYAYIYAGRHDRLCEIVNECVHRSFGLGRSGLPGNNDSGGLSSCFIWNALGLFPVSGSGEFLIGTPAVDEAEIRLFSGKTLTIRAYGREDGKNIYVDSVRFGGEEIKDYRLSVGDVMMGGTLEFYMK